MSYPFDPETGVDLCTYKGCGRPADDDTAHPQPEDETMGHGRHVYRHEEPKAKAKVEKSFAGSVPGIAREVLSGTDGEVDITPFDDNWTHGHRPVIKIRINAVGRGSIRIDDGPELPVRRMRIFSGVNQATRVWFDLIAVNIDAELPVDEIQGEQKPLPVCRRCGSKVLGKLTEKHPCVPFRSGYRRGEPRMVLPLVP